jgi:UMF1 family MFS transporter
LARFLLAYFVYMEGVATVVYYTSIYARDTLGFSLAELLYFFLVLQTVGVCGAVGLGWLSDWIGPRITLLAILCCWTLVAVGVALVYSKALFWMVSMVGVICLGSIQAVSRSMIALMVSRAQEAEIFGFYGVSGKLSSAAGPLLFGTISFVSGSQRVAMLAVALIFLLGLLLLMRVEDPPPTGKG